MPSSNPASHQRYIAGPRKTSLPGKKFQAIPAFLNNSHSAKGCTDPYDWLRSAAACSARAGSLQASGGCVSISRTMEDAHQSFLMGWNEFGRSQPPQNAPALLSCLHAQPGMGTPHRVACDHSSVTLQSPRPPWGDITPFLHHPGEPRGQLAGNEPRSHQVRVALAPAALPPCELQGNGDFGIQLHHHH